MANQTQNMKVILSAVDRLSPVFDSIKKNAAVAERRLNAFGRGGMVMGGGIAAGMGIAIKSFADVENAESKLNSAMMQAGGIIPASFGKISELAERLGDKLPGTTADMELMMSALIKNGTKPEDILNGVGTATAYLAVKLDMAKDQAAEFAAKMQSATNATAEDSMKMLDVIQRLEGVGIDPQKQLAAFAALKPVLSSIKQQGSEAAKTLAPLLVMNKEISGETVGIAVSKVVRLGLDKKKVDDVNSMLAPGGIKLDFTDGKGGFGGIENMFKQMEKLKALTPQQFQTIMPKLFGDDAQTLQVISSLVNTNYKTYQSIQNNLMSQASLEEKVNSELNTLSNKWESATGTFTNLLAQFGKVYADDAKRLVDAFGDWSAKLRVFVGQHPKFVRNITAFAGAIAGIKIAALAAAVGIRIMSLTMLASPVGLFVTALAGAAALAAENWDTVGPTFQAAWASISQGAQKAWAVVGPVVGHIGDELQSFWRGININPKLMWSDLVNGAKSIYATIQPILSATLDGFGRFWDSIKAYAGSIWAAVKPGVDAFSHGFAALWNALGNGGAAIWTAIKPGLSAAMNGIKSIISSIPGMDELFKNGEIIAPVLNKVFDILQKSAVLFFTLLGKGLELAGDGMSWLAGGLQKMPAIIDSLQTAWAGLSSGLSGIWKSGVDAIFNAWDGAASGLSASWKYLQSVWDGLISGLAGIWQSGVDAISNAWDGAASGLGASWQSLKSWFAGLISGLAGIWQSGVDAISNAWDGAASGLSASWQALQTAWTGLSSGLSGVWQSGIDLVMSAWNAVESGLTASWQALQTAWANLSSGVVSPWKTGNDLVMSAWNAVESGLTASWQALQTAWTALSSGVFSPWKTGIDLVMSVWNAVESGLTASWQALQTAWTGLSSGVVSPWKTGIDLVMSAWNAVESGLTASWQALQAAWAVLSSGLAGLWQVCVDAITTAWDSAKSGIEDKSSTLWTFLQSGWDDLSKSWGDTINALPKLWDNAKDAIFSIWDGIQHRWDDLTGAFRRGMEWFRGGTSSPSRLVPPVANPGAAGFPAMTPGEMPNIPHLGGKPIVFRPEIESIIQSQAQAQGVDPALIRAMMKQESSGNVNALSPKGAAGLMQLMPATARRFGVVNRYDPAQNIEGGVKYLAWLLKRYRGDETRAVAAYNAGEGAVDKYGGVPPYKETRDYVSKILKNVQHQRIHGGIDVTFNNPPAGTRIESRQSKSPVKINPKFGRRTLGPSI